jgi:hypothetical protein
MHAPNATPDTTRSSIGPSATGVSGLPGTASRLLALAFALLLPPPQRPKKPERAAGAVLSGTARLAVDGLRAIVCGAPVPPVGPSRPAGKTVLKSLGRDKRVNRRQLIAVL